MILIIYFIGYILAFILGRQRTKEETEINEWNTWADVLATALFSMLSWGLVIILILSMDCGPIKSKPPKWL